MLQPIFRLSSHITKKENNILFSMTLPYVNSHGSTEFLEFGLKITIDEYHQPKFKGIFAKQMPNYFPELNYTVNETKSFTAVKYGKCSLHDLFHEGLIHFFSSETKNILFYESGPHWEKVFPTKSNFLLNAFQTHAYQLESSIKDRLNPEKDHPWSSLYKIQTYHELDKALEHKSPALKKTKV